MFWLIVGSIVFGALGTVLLLFYIKRGQFEENEEVKYQIFHDDVDR
jgi:cbb3-type cytochrome oxidase maturation protein